MDRARNILLAALGGSLGAIAVYDINYWIGAFRSAPLAQDTSLYYVAAQIGLRQGWSRIYDPSLQANFLVALQPGFAQDFFLFGNPPVMAWLMAPLTLLSPVAAYLVVVGISFAALLGIGLLAAPWRGRVLLIAILAPLAWYPVIYCLRLGQVSLLVGLLVALCWWLERRALGELAGLVLALTAIKPQLALLVAPCLLLAGRWRVAAGWLAGTVVLAGLSLLSLGAEGVGQYFRVLNTLHGEIYNEVFTLASVTGGAGWTIFLQIAVACVTMAAAYRIRRGPTSAVIALALLGGLLAAPYVHVDDYAVLVPAAWLLVRAGRPLYHTLSLIPLAISIELAWVLGPYPILAALAGCLVLFFVPSADAQQRAHGADHHVAMVA